MILSNLGATYSNQNLPDKAETNYNEALFIRRKLAEENPKKYLPDVIWTLNSLADLHQSANQMELASQERAELAALTKKLEELR